MMASAVACIMQAMRSASDIYLLLDELDHHVADDLEDQDLDFKQWNERSMGDSISTVVEMAICMANGGGGTVVFGVADRVRGRAAAVLGVPPEVEINLLLQAVYNRTEPKLTPTFEAMRVPEGSGRLVLMHVHSGLPPYTDSSGGAKVRIGKDCQPLVGSLRRKLVVETGEGDLTAETIPGTVEEHISAAALETLRERARSAGGPDELLRADDLDLLQRLGLVEQGRLTKAGLLIAGKGNALRRHLPNFAWTHLRMRGDTDYHDRDDGNDALPVALERLSERVNADNPVQTRRVGLYHFEYRTYPEVALREALLNALSHADYRSTSPMLVKQYPDRLEISNGGGFVGGIRPDNILHHHPVPRNPRLVNALIRLRLVNRSNIGVPRMYREMLIEGKEPPHFEDLGDGVRVTFRALPLSPAFREFVAGEEEAGRYVDVDQLLIVQHLLRHMEVDLTAAARLCQRDEAQTRETLALMEVTRGYLERGGAGRGLYWTLRPDLHERLSRPGDVERNRRLDWEAAKTRVLSVLKQRAERGQAGLANGDIRRITHLDRRQVKRLTEELRAEGVRVTGRGRSAKWVYGSDAPSPAEPP